MSNSAHFLHFLFRSNSSHFLHFFPLKFRSFLAFFIPLKFRSFLAVFFLSIPHSRHLLHFFERNLSELLDLGLLYLNVTSAFELKWIEPGIELTFYYVLREKIRFSKLSFSYSVCKQLHMEGKTKFLKGVIESFITGKFYGKVLLLL